jgi:hypothetical protein
MTRLGGAHGAYGAPEAETFEPEWWTEPASTADLGAEEETWAEELVAPFPESASTADEVPTAWLFEDDADGADEHVLHDEGPDETELRAEAEAEAEATTIGDRVAAALRRGFWEVAIRLMVASGVRDENRLTNVVFHARHPELGGRSLRADEATLGAEWRAIREEIVRPLLRSGSGTGTGGAPGARPRTLSTRALRAAWHTYLNATERMTTLSVLGWRTPVNPETIEAWRALERALVDTGYHAHRAWVYVPRKIKDTNSPSLHAYGLAIDIDHRKPKCNVNRPTPDGRVVRFATAATKEERCREVRDGIADTVFTPEQVGAVESIRTVDGHQAFAWGGRWTDRKDTMHFQINVTPEELRRGLASSASGQRERVDDARLVVREPPALGELEAQEQLLGVGSLIAPVAAAATGGLAALPRWLLDRLEKAFRDRAAELRHLITHYAGVERAFWEAGGGPRGEGDPAVLTRLQEYATAAGAANPVATARDFAADRVFWSAAFVCHVFRRAGVRLDEFAFNIGHDEYIKRAHRHRAARSRLAHFWLCTPQEVAPEMGDILCSNRGGNVTYTPGLSDGGLPADFGSHGDIVTGMSVNSRGEPVLVTTGGNVGDSVRRRFVPVDSTFRITATSHRGVEPASRRPEQYFAVVRIRSSITEVYP